VGREGGRVRWKQKGEEEERRRGGRKKKGCVWREEEEKVGGVEGGCQEKEKEI
jgi:hypothetical protein